MLFGMGKPIVHLVMHNLFPGSGLSPIGHPGGKGRQESPRPSVLVGRLWLAKSDIRVSWGKAGSVGEAPRPCSYSCPWTQLTPFLSGHLSGAPRRNSASRAEEASITAVPELPAGEGLMLRQMCPEVGVRTIPAREALLIGTHHSDPLHPHPLLFSEGHSGWRV